MSGYFKSIKKNFKIKNYVNYIGILIWLTVLIIMQNNGSLARSSSTLLVQIAYGIILAVSLNLVVGFLGELSLGHAGFMCVGAYIGCFIANILHQHTDDFTASILDLSNSVDSSLLTSIINTVINSIPLLILIISMIIGGITAAIFGVIIGIPSLRLKGDYLAIVTLAFGEIVRTIFKNLDTFGGARGLRTTKYSGTLFIPAFVVILIMLIVIQNLMRSKHGRAITSIRDNEIAAKAMGINVVFYKLLGFTIAAFFAGVAGVIYGHMTTPLQYSFFDYNYSIEILVMVVLGGMGSINGSIIAAILITYINFQLTTRLSGDLAALKFLIYALILIIMVIFNNAPAFASIRAKLSLKNFKPWLHAKSAPNPEKDAARIKDDEASWSRVPTKINMDAILSSDIKKEPHASDKSSKGGK